MKRFVWGVILTSIGGLWFILSMTAVIRSSTTSEVMHFTDYMNSLLLAGGATIGGVILMGYGWRAMQQRKLVELLALDQFNKTGAIEPRMIAVKAGMSEADARRIITAGQREGAIPMDSPATPHPSAPHDSPAPRPAAPSLSAPTRTPR